MYQNKKIIAIIPARGGSKGLPKKNIKIMNGKPLLAWTIEQAKSSKYIDEIFVSTDSQEIADISEKYGVKVPSLRPKELAEDVTNSMDVIIYTLEYLENQTKSFDIVIMLEATSPLREVKDIDNAIEQLINTQNAESIVGVCKVEGVHPAFLAYKGKNNFISPYLGDNFIFKRRQDIDELYFFEGSLYASYVDSVKKRKSFYHEKTLGYEVEKYKSFEVDDMIDFKIIETLLKLKENGEI